VALLERAHAVGERLVVDRGRRRRSGQIAKRDQAVAQQ